MQTQILTLQPFTKDLGYFQFNFSKKLIKFVLGYEALTSRANFSYSNPCKTSVNTFYLDGGDCVVKMRSCNP